MSRHFGGRVSVKQFGPRSWTPEIKSQALKMIPWRKRHRWGNLCKDKELPPYSYKSWYRETNIYTNYEDAHPRASGVTSKFTPIGLSLWEWEKSLSSLTSPNRLSEFLHHTWIVTYIVDPKRIPLTRPGPSDRTRHRSPFRRCLDKSPFLSWTQRLVRRHTKCLR